MRDEALPHGQRLRALAQLVGWAQPIGFNPTWHYLEATLGVPRERPEFLIPALGLLERERRLHLDLDVRYAALRRYQKRKGSRRPGADDATPRVPQRWHGDEREAAAHALRWWLQRHPMEDFVDQPHAVLAVDVARALASGPKLTSFDLSALQESLIWARANTRTGRNLTRAERYGAYRIQHLLGHIYILLNGAPSIGVAWNFTPSADEPTHGSAVARARLSTPVGLWRSTPQDRVTDLSTAAADLLVLGYDTPALRELAGLSSGDSFYEVEPVLAAALDQLGRVGRPRSRGLPCGRPGRGEAGPAPSIAGLSVMAQSTVLRSAAAKAVAPSPPRLRALPGARFGRTDRVPARRRCLRRRGARPVPADSRPPRNGRAHRSVLARPN